MIDLFANQSMNILYQALIDCAGKEDDAELYLMNHSAVNVISELVLAINKMGYDIKKAGE